MLTEHEFTRARTLVQQVLKNTNGDRTAAITAITDMCSVDPTLHQLFASVGMELYESSMSVKH